MDKSKEQLNKKGDRRGIHPNSLKNLELARKKGKGWTRGHSGNPNGYSLTGLARDLLNEIPDVLIDKKRNTKTWRELIVEAWLVSSYKGNATYFKELIERIEGKVAQPLTDGEGEQLVPRQFNLVLPEGTTIRPGRMGGNGHKEEVEAGGDGHKN